jgi:hypothetical protein
VLPSLPPLRRAAADVQHQEQRQPDGQRTAKRRAAAALVQRAADPGLACRQQNSARLAGTCTSRGEGWVPKSKSAGGPHIQGGSATCELRGVNLCSNTVGAALMLGMSGALPAAPQHRERHTVKIRAAALALHTAIYRLSGPPAAVPPSGKSSSGSPPVSSMPSRLASAAACSMLLPAAALPPPALAPPVLPLPPLPPPP